MPVVHQEVPHQLSDKFRHVVSSGDTGGTLFDQGMLSKIGANAWRPIAPGHAITMRIDGTSVTISDAPDPLPAWFYPTLQATVRLFYLEPDWDSYGANPISRLAAETGLVKLFEVMESSSPPPTVVPVPDGSLQFEWHRNGLDVEIEISRTGISSFFIENDSTNVEMQGDWSDISELKEAIDQLSE